MIKSGIWFDTTFWNLIYSQSLTRRGLFNIFFKKDLPTPPFLKQGAMFLLTGFCFYFHFVCVVRCVSYVGQRSATTSTSNKKKKNLKKVRTTFLARKSLGALGLGFTTIRVRIKILFNNMSRDGHLNVQVHFIGSMNAVWLNKSTDEPSI